MIKIILLSTILLLFCSLQSSAQKLDSILDRSTLSFNYGLSHDFFAIPEGGGGPSNLLEFYGTSGWGQIFGFEYSYRPEGKKNEWGFGFSKQVHRKEYNEDAGFRGVIVRFESIVLRNFKNFHHIHWKRHIIENKLLGSVGLYYHRYRDQVVDFSGDFDGNFIVDIRESTRFIDFGIFLGVEYYHDIRNFQIGLRSRLFYTQGYSESFESFEFTPVIKFRL